MSAASAGKFQDHYAILGVDATATSEAIHLAYEVLSDGSLRREFDKLKGLDQDPEFQFTGSAFFSELSRGVNLRLALLCVLYDRRRLRPFTPALRCGSLKTSWRPPAKS